ncbi:B3 domain-containing protein At1g20600-like [Cucumis melo]|uniref:B3 domain-containing protein At1g20600-like n=1 Tax=Cucumis melo TaxID=3656 RepID=A0A9I9CIF5_CUCME|nr:B3 domain-containing protein At1g20600-like [Cucumis melo]
MVKVGYIYNNKIVEKEVYEACLALCEMKKSSEPFEEPNQFPSSTSISMVDDQPPVVNEQPPIVNEHAPVVNEALLNNNNNNNENVAAVVADRDLGRLPPMVVIQNIIGECSPPFVKQLTKTDVTDSQGRLALHKEFVNRNLVPMFNGDEILTNGISVTVYDSEGREYDMTFRLWTSKLYVLTKSWKKFYHDNGLTRPDEFITLWMFRHVVNHKLCFAIMRGNVEGH